jgi:hydroxymethylpyrimidine/phosphomethylpyrimidine kinase
MKTFNARPPIVLAFSAHDPSGAAGIQADIESIHRNGARCVSVLTALTAQNTGTFETLLPQQPVNFIEQATMLLADINIDAFKIGLVGSAELVNIIADIVARYPELPVVLDPVLHAGVGTGLASAELITQLIQRLIPLTTVLTPNLKEAQRLSGETDSDAAAAVLLNSGCRNVLITGADEQTDRADTEPVHFDWDRLPGVYHGSGCTLAAAIAAQLAQHNDVVKAVTVAQQYCWQALAHGYPTGTFRNNSYRDPSSAQGYLPDHRT